MRYVDLVHVVLVAKICSTSSTPLPSTIPRIILNHFGKQGCTAYFCYIDNAATFSKAATQESYLFHSSAMHGSEHVNLAKPGIGIFLDARCPEGLQFLQENKRLLNASYNWLIWSEETSEVLKALESSRLNIDSDLTIVVQRPEVSGSSDDVSSGNETIESYIMFEIYRKHDSMPVEIKEYQMWRNGLAYSLAPRSDRSDLGQIRFNGSIWLPIMNISEVTIEELTDPSFALNVDVRWRYGISLFMTICQNYMNCSIQLIQARCNDESSITLCNQSIGVVDQVRRGIADFGIVPLTWDHVLSDVDYSLPVLTVKASTLLATLSGVSGIRPHVLTKMTIDVTVRSVSVTWCSIVDILILKFLFLQPKMVSSCLALLRPLSTEIWVLLAVLLVLTAVAFKIVSPFDDTSQHNDGWVGSAFLVVSALAQQGVPDNTYKLTTRIIYVCVLGVTFFVYTYYSTALLNGLLLPPPQSIRFAADLFNSHLALGLQESTLIRHRLVALTYGFISIDISIGDEEFNELIRMLQGDHLDGGLFDKLSAGSSAEGFISAADGVTKIVDEPFAIFGEELDLREQLWSSKMTYAEMCSVGIVDDVRLPRQASFILPKNSPYKELLRRGIVRSRERGAMDRLKTDWLPGIPECLWKTDAVQFGFEPLFVAYVIAGIGIIVSLVILMGEKLNRKSKMQIDLNSQKKDLKKMS